MPRPLAPVMLASVLAIATALPVIAEPAIRAVTLSTAGLALVEAEGALGPDPLRLTVPRDQIDDALKSLRVADPAGAVARLTLDGPGAFDDVFAALPLSPDDVTDPLRLLAAMIGAPLAVDTSTGTLDGTNMGVSQRDCDAGTCPVLTLLTDHGLRHVWLDSTVTVRFADTTDRAALETALAALRTGPAPRRIEVAITTDDDRPRAVGLTWLQSAPVWRTAWRAVAGAEGDGGGLDLTGWAVIENATGRDWQDIRLTLATGAVRAIAPDLYDRRHAWREPSAAPAMARSFAVSEAMAMDSAVAETDTADSDSVTRFTLSEPVTLAAGQMISLPFLARSLPEARLRLHRGGSGATHPLIALQIDNPLPLRLPAGVLTLYEDGIGHAGDALIPELAPGATAIVDFARDTAIEVRETVARDEVVRDIRLVRGVLEVAEDIVRETRYRISGAPAADRVLTLDHPRADDWALDDPNGVEARPDAWRWRIDLPAGAEVTMSVRERQPRLRRLAVIDLDAPTLAEWQALSPDPALRERLAMVAEARRDLAAAEAALTRTTEEIAALEREQSRLVDLIVRLDDGTDATRARRARVDALDAQIAAAEDRRRDLIDQIEVLRAEIADLLAG